MSTKPSREGMSLEVLRGPIMLGTALVGLAACGAPSPKGIIPQEAQRELYSRFMNQDPVYESVVGCSDGCQDLRREFRYVGYVGQQIYA